MIAFTWFVEVHSESGWTRAAEEYETQAQAEAAIEDMVSRGHDRVRFRCRTRMEAIEEREARQARALIEEADRGWEGQS